jgi:hypothetical protein
LARFIGDAREYLLRHFATESGKSNDNALCRRMIVAWRHRHVFGR